MLPHPMSGRQTIKLKLMWSATVYERVEGVLFKIVFCTHCYYFCIWLWWKVFYLEVGYFNPFHVKKSIAVKMYFDSMYQNVTHSLNRDSHPFAICQMWLQTLGIGQWATRPRWITPQFRAPSTLRTNLTWIRILFPTLSCISLVLDIESTAEYMMMMMQRALDAYL